MSVYSLRKHPDVIAFENYETGHPESFDCSTLGDSTHNNYLRNRLEAAFYAGIKIAEIREELKNRKMSDSLETILP